MGSTRHQKRIAAIDKTVDGGRRTVVVLPSRAVDRWHEPRAETQAYEERLLSFMFELCDPGLEMIYVTSLPIAPRTIDYYSSMLPAPLRLSARKRLRLVSLGDGGRRQLSAKLLERAPVLKQIRRAIDETRPGYLLPYNGTVRERDVGRALDIPIYGVDPIHAELGTKSGSRQLFALAGVPHPLGAEHIKTVPDAINAICRLRATKPELSELVMKLDQGVSGEGNAIVDLTHLPAPGAPDERGQIDHRLATLDPQVPGVTVADYLAKLARQGGIAEERITSLELRSPSVQIEIRPAGQVQLLSTHDQILGGPSGHRYDGCRFPADPSYAPLIGKLAIRAAEHLADIGVIGRLGIDFVVTPRPARRWEAFALELNLRMGGTTHPYQTLAALTGGAYDAERAIFVTSTGQPRHYLATDHLQTPSLGALGRERVLALARDGELRFDRAAQVGVVLHMLPAIDELSRVGVTAIGRSAEHANALFDHARTALNRLGGATGRRRVSQQSRATA